MWCLLLLHLTPTAPRLLLNTPVNVSENSNFRASQTATSEPQKCSTLHEITSFVVTIVTYRDVGVMQLQQLDAEKEVVNPASWATACCLATSPNPATVPLVAPWSWTETSCPRRLADVVSRVFGVAEMWEIYAGFWQHVSPVGIMQCIVLIAVCWLPGCSEGRCRCRCRCQCLDMRAAAPDATVSQNGCPYHVIALASFQTVHGSDHRRARWCIAFTHSSPWYCVWAGNGRIRLQHLCYSYGGDYTILSSFVTIMQSKVVYNAPTKITQRFFSKKL